MAKELKFTEAQLAEAINNVQCFSDLGADLIAKQVFADALESSAAPVGEREVVMPERKDDQGAPTVNLHIFREGWNACLDEFARLNGKEVV